MTTTPQKRKHALPTRTTPPYQVRKPIDTEKEQAAEKKKMMFQEQMKDMEVKNKKVRFMVYIPHV
jgi:hypothetical protein